MESGAGLQPIPLIIWSPADGKDCTVELPTPETLNKLHPQFETRSRLLALAPGAIFKNPALQDYRPSRDLALPGAAPLPADIQKALGWPATARNVPGAQQSHDTLNPE